MNDVFYGTQDPLKNDVDMYIEKQIESKLPKKFFISQPMRDKTEIEITAERTMIKERIKREYNPRAEFIDSIVNLDNEIKTKNHKTTALLYLGESLKKLAEADAIVMATGWESAPGCRIEHQAAKEYYLKIYYI